MENKNIFIFVCLLILILLGLMNLNEYFGNKSLKKKIVIIEPRNHPNLLNLINNIINNKPKDWDIQAFVGKDLDISKLPKKDNQDNLIIYTRLKSNNLFSNHYNNLFKTVDFWNQIDAEYIQIMQTDSALCSNSKFNLDQFIKFPYIGCSSWLHAWSDKLHNIEDKNEISCLGIGGFSLRQKSVMIECINDSKKMKFTGNENELTEKSAVLGGEDFFFARCIVKKKLKIPTENDMINYCIEYNFKEDSEIPVGIHTSQISKKAEKFMSKKCPDGKYAIKNIKKIDII